MTKPGERADKRLMGTCTLARWGLCFLLASWGLRAQTVTGTFLDHQIRISAVDNCAVTTPASAPTQSSFTLSINASCKGASISGQIQLDYPAATPAATLSPVTSLLTFQTALATAIRFSGQWTAPDKTFTATTTMVSQVDLNVLDQRGDRCSEPRTSAALAAGASSFSGGRACSQGVVPTGAVTGGRRIIALRYLINFAMKGSGDSLPRAYVTADVTSYYVIASPVSVDLAVDHLEVVQVVQNASNTIPLISGKSAVARVFPVMLGDSAQPVSGVTGTLRGIGKDGAELPGSPLIPATGAVTAGAVVTRETLNGSLNFRLPREWTAAGLVRLVAEIRLPDGATDSNPGNNTLTQDVVFSPALASPFYLYYWPLCYEPPGKEKTCPSENISGLDVLTSKLYPLPDDGVQYLRWQTPEKVWKQPLVTGEDTSKLLASLRKFYDFVDEANGGIDQLAAWLPSIGSLLGKSDPKWIGEGGQGRVTMNVDTSGTDRLDAAMTLAHETAHNLGLRHTNTADGCGAQDSKSQWPYRNATVQEVGFDPAEMVVKPGTKMDMMSYCAPPGSNIWISPDSYVNLMFSDTWKRPASNTAQGKEAPSASAAQYLLVSGTVWRDGSVAQLDPAYRVTSGTPGAAPDPNANHCLRFSGPAGALASYCFTLDFTVHWTDAPLDRESFSLKVQYPDGATRVALQRGGQELASLSTGSGAPQVNITAPQPGELWNAVRTIAWTASAPDGGALTHAVLYSPDGGQSWRPIELDTTEQQLSFDTVSIQAGSQVYFRVVTTSGLSTGTATVGPISIAISPRIAVGPASLDFGVVGPGQSGVLTLTLNDKGNGPLRVSALRVSSSDYSVSAPQAPLSVAAGARVAVTVTFNPSSAGARPGTLTVASDDPANPVLTIPLSGFAATSLASRFDADASRVDFGSVTAGQSKDTAFTVRNTGGAALVISSVTSSNPAFTAIAPVAPIRVEAGAQQVVTLRFSPTAAGAQSGTITFASNDPDRPSTAVAVSGQGQNAARAATVVVSDSFNRADASKCSLGPADLASGGSGAWYYVPVFSTGAVIAGGTLTNASKDFGGVQLTTSAAPCSVRGSNLGQDLTLRAELRVPADSVGNISQAGLYFRDRAGAAGDGIIGGDSAGYWVILHSTGEVKIKNLNDSSYAAASLRVPGFDASVFHTLQATVQGTALVVTLDGQTVTFTQGSSLVTTVAIPATRGSNDGTAGVAFGAENNRGAIGGQQARNLEISR
jgi:hypothetical protein